MLKSLEFVPLVNGFHTVLWRLSYKEFGLCLRFWAQMGVSLLLLSPLSHTWIYADEVTHGEIAWCGLVMLEKPTSWLEGWSLGSCDISPTSWPPGTRGMLDTELNYMAKTPIKILDTKAEGSFLVGEHISVLGGWWTLIPRGEGMKSLCLELCQTSPYVSLHLAVPDLYPLW